MKHFCADDFCRGCEETMVESHVEIMGEKIGPFSTNQIDPSTPTLLVNI